MTLTTDHRSVWETYAQAWKAPSAQEKQAGLASSTHPSCVYRDPAKQANGHEELVAYMLSFHEQIPGAWFETTYFLAHHDRSIAKWNMRSADNTILGDGISYGEYGPDGKLTAMTGFFTTE